MAVAMPETDWKIRGPSERCPVLAKCSIPITNPEGWHRCRLREGHPGPHECAHGQFPAGVRLWEAGPDNGKLVLTK